MTRWEPCPGEASRMMTRVKVFILLLCVTGIGVISRTISMFSIDWLQGQKSPPVSFVPLWSDSTRNLSLCSCAKCLSEDKQLVENQHIFTQPFLSNSYSLSLDNFNWWKRLQSERCNLDTYQATVKTIFEMFPPEPDMVQPSPHRCRTCAVVGNSHNLKKSGYGKIIDSQDVVIRMNFGPTKGYEQDIGTKTTHRALYPESASDLQSNTHLVLFPFKLLDLQWLIKALSSGFTGRSYAPVRAKIQANKTLVMVVNPAFMRHVHDFWLDRKGHYPSTGFMTLILALYFCDEVHVFGFGADGEGNWSHYWQALKNSKSVNVIHPAQHEYNVILRLAQQGKFKMYKGV